MLSVNIRYIFFRFIPCSSFVSCFIKYVKKKAFFYFYFSLYMKNLADIMKSKGFVRFKIL